MGIRGLTTFIHNRSNLYMEKYQLYDTNVVIDGNSLACQLYKWHCKSNDCFGGDYDKYFQTVTNFFKILAECNINPYVIFDGGYEARKVATVITRMKNKIKSAHHLDTVTEGSISVFPLFLRETFEDIVMKLNIKCVRCDFEGDTETANIARALNCPVISYDSDYFIFDVLYIPFSSVEMTVRKKKKPNSKEMSSYIRCEIYRVEKFLNHYGGMDKSNLPILAVLLGNDYIKRSQFSLFYNNLKRQKCHGSQSEQQKIIKSLIIWLQNETIDSAIRKVLSRYKCKKRRWISLRIQRAMRGYNCHTSEYLKYLEISVTNNEEIQEINLDNIVKSIDEENIDEENIDQDGDEEVCQMTSDSEEEECSSSDEAVINEEEEISSYEDDLNNCEDFKMNLFKDNFRKCLYPPCFMDILLSNRYFCQPQVENSSLEYSHAISSDILSAIHKILTNSDTKLGCIARNKHGHVKKYSLPACDVEVPSFIELPGMNSGARKKLLLKILKISDDFVINCLNLFPEKWHLFIITLKYLIDKSVLTWPLLYSVLLCKIVLGYVDDAIGVYRSSKVFEKKFGNTINDILNNKKDSGVLIKNTILESLESISYNDSLMCLKTLLPYFQIDVKMRISNRSFDRNLVHTMAQFQSCLLHVKYLNRLLNYPYSNFIMSELYNGTLIYNLTSNFVKRTNLNDYIKIFLQNCPSVENCLLLITDSLRQNCNNDNIVCPKVSKRRRKNKKPKEVTASESDKEETEENDFVYDPHNKFSILSVS